MSSTLVKSFEAVPNPFAFVPGIFHEMQKLDVILFRHRRSLLGEFAYGSRVALRCNVIFGN
jgi:hypothetical protein